MQAPVEQLAYVVLLDPTGSKRPDVERRYLVVPGINSSRI